MKKLLAIMLLLMLIAVPVSATEIVAPEAPPDAVELLPFEQESFGQGLWYVIVTALEHLMPDIVECALVCVSVFTAVMLTSLMGSLEGNSKSAVELAGVVVISCLMLRSANSLVNLGAETVNEISSYGTLLLPVMTAALASQGGTSSSAAIYAGTAFFDSVLSGVIRSVLIPFVYVFIALAIVNAATGNGWIQKLQEFVKCGMTWCLKTVLYVFTGYIGITGVISGAADQAAVKAAKLTISGAVPVVGNIMSDASETLLVGMSVAKNAAGIYGMLAMVAIAIGPFLKIGVQYLFWKLMAAVCAMFSDKKRSGLIGDFSVAMGFLLAMTGSVCLLQGISVICFLKGMT